MAAYRHRGSPGSAIGGLVGLAKIHPGLAEVAVTMVLDLDDVYDSDPWRWRDVQSDALGMIANGLHDETIDTPEGVFVSSQRYPLSQFALDDKHQADAAKLAELQGTTVDELELRLIATRWSRPASCTPRTPRSMAG